MGLAVVVGCGPAVADSVASAGNSGSSTGEPPEETSSVETQSSGVSTDTGSTTADQEECYAAGGHVEFLDGPRFINDALGELAGPFHATPGLIARADGLWASFATWDPGVDGLLAAYGVELDLQGWPTGVATPRELPWGAGLVAKGPGDHAIVSYCDADVLGWVIVDLYGRPVSEPIGVEDPLHCFPESLAYGTHGPVAAWTSRGDGIVAWVGPDGDGRGWRVLAAGIDDRGLGVVHEVHEVVTISGAPRLALGANADTALVVQQRWSDESGPEELVSTLLHATGEPLGPPSTHALPGGYFGPDVKVLADLSGDYFVYVGDYGSPLGVMRLDAAGRLVDALHELPTTDHPSFSHVYGNLLGVEQGPGVHYVYGTAWDGFNTVLITAFDRDGNRLGEVGTTGTKAAVASAGQRTWVLMDYAGSGLQVAEIGCVPG
jgi:hypothetical protein